MSSDPAPQRTTWSYAEPFGWWGQRVDGPRRSISALVAGGVLTARVAAFLWLALEHRATLVVAAEPHGAGKTTFLTALLDFLPAATAPTFLRGWYERFAFLETTTPGTAYLLCNEISSHLPIYLWGRGVRRVFEAVAAGYGMATTVHGGGAADVLALLTAYPLEVPLEQAAGIDFVLTLGVGMRQGETARRLMRLEDVRWEPARGEVEIEVLAERDVLLGPLVARPGRLVSALTARYGLDPDEAANELARRERLLESLAHDGVTDPGAVRAAIHTARAT